VIAQVERVTKTGTLDPRSVAVPSVLVDAVVEAPASHHPQTYAEAYNPAYSGEIKPPASDSPDDAPLSARKIIARRAAMELSSDAVINLGVGVPELIPAVAAEGGIDDEITQTVESGPVGGSASGGISFGTATGHTKRSSPPPSSSTSTTAAVSTSDSWGWPRSTRTATST